MTQVYESNPASVSHWIHTNCRIWSPTYYGRRIHSPVLTQIATNNSQVTGLSPPNRYAAMLRFQHVSTEPYASEQNSAAALSIPYCSRMRVANCTSHSGHLNLS